MDDVREREHSSANAETPEREWARARVEKKHKLRGDFAAYVAINLALVAAWALTGFGYFWPGWILTFWGVFLLLDAWNIYHRRRPVTEDEVDEELRRHR
jgi:fatty acid desaturase